LFVFCPAGDEKEKKHENIFRNSNPQEMSQSWEKWRWTAELVKNSARKNLEACKEKSEKQQKRRKFAH
jgi:hypothetical protein